ncbi:thiamine pyrophosphate-dependent enzyme [Streptomyces sp. 1222.5]|uniref:thiamine pyrophosphate-dependent enzyme n=1 Tax=Streptomyces sp. 1222.5 TaxID=1881026 RepID=UPI003D75C127
MATGVKRSRPDLAVLTVQGDGDMADEGLQEVLHAAARGERSTCFMLNNGVFGKTRGHMTATTVIGQRTKNTLEGRDSTRHGHPIRLANRLAQLDGAVYIARGAVDTAVNVHRTKRMVLRALRAQEAGFTFVNLRRERIRDLLKGPARARLLRITFPIRLPSSGSGVPC